MLKIKPLIISIVLLIVWFVIAFAPDYIERNNKQKPLHLHEANSNGTLEVDWIVNDLIISTGEKTTNLFVSNDKLYLYGALDSWDFALWQISKSDGEFLENVTPSRLSIPLSFDDIDAISFDSSFIYIAYTGDHTIKDSSIAAGGFAVYDTFREELIWSSRIPSLNGVDSFIAGQNFIVIDNNFGKYYITDIANRSILPPIEKLDAVSAFEQGIPYYDASAALWYVQVNGNGTSSSFEVWQNNLDGIYLTPIVTLDRVIVRTNPVNSVGEVRLYDRIGNLVLTSPILTISNVVVKDNSAYYLALPNQLIEWDLINGKTETLYEFSGGKFLLEDHRGYFIAIDEATLFIYLGDSRQLFSFEFKPN